MTRSDSEWESYISSKLHELQNNEKSLPNAWTHVSDKEIQNEKLAATIDHTLLKPDATPDQIRTLCDEALKYKFKSCCVNGANVKQVAEHLAVEGSRTVPCAVIGFPLGASATEVKVFETRRAIQDGAKEIDMVINIGRLKAKDYVSLSNDISQVVEAAATIPVKVIIETVFLTDEEKVVASVISAEAEASFVKTSTGFSGGGATKEDITLMKRAVAYKPTVQVKASAGIRSFEKCLEMLRAGADRIGTSSGCAIMEKAVGSGY